MIQVTADSSRIGSVTCEKMCYESWLIMSRKSVVRITDHPDMTSAVYHGSKVTNQSILNISQRDITVIVIFWFIYYPSTVRKQFTIPAPIFSHNYLRHNYHRIHMYS